MGAGTILGVAGDIAAARRRNRILSEGQRTQSRAGMETSGTMGDFLTQLRGSMPNPAAERGAFSSALGHPGISAPITGSARFRGDAAGATTGAQGYGGDMADLLARIRAPGLQRQGESQTLIRMGDALRPIQARAQDEDFLTQLRAGSVQSDPWLQLAGQGLSNVGSYYLGQGKKR